MLLMIVIYPEFGTIYSGHPFAWFEHVIWPTFFFPLFGISVRELVEDILNFPFLIEHELKTVTMQTKFPLDNMDTQPYLSHTGIS